MARVRHSKRKHIGSYAAYNHILERARLSQEFGGIDKDIEDIFLKLPDARLRELLVAYEASYGKKAADYALSAIPKWRNGQTKMSGQTASRLLDLVPPFLSANARFSLVKKLRQHHLQRKHIHITAGPEDWRERMTSALDCLVSYDQNNGLPQEIVDKATWLSNGDATAAQRLLAASDQELANIRLSHVKEEMSLIQGMLLRAEQKGRVDLRIEHAITIPQGSVTIVIERLAPTLLNKIIKWLGL